MRSPTGLTFEPRRVDCGVTVNQWSRLKLTRSWWLFSELLGRVEVWNTSGDFAADVRILEDRSALEFLTPAGFRPPIAEWGLLVGDAVHNARSALDALVWDLAHSEGATPGAPHRVMFPVTKSEREWKSTVKSLETVPEGPLERMRLAQPWAVESAEPNQSWLKILSRLDNDDKHRGRVVALPMQESIGLDMNGLSLGEPLPEGGYMHMWGSGLDGTEPAGTPFARFGLGARIAGDPAVHRTASIQLAPAVVVFDQMIPVAALQQEMLGFIRGLLDEVAAGAELHETWITPQTRSHD